MKLILAFVLICSVSAFPSVRNRRQTSKLYDVVNIEINEPETRNKRSTDAIFPNELHAKFTSKGKQQLIRLRRSPTAPFPIFNSIGPNATRINVPKSKRSAVYQDIETNAPVLVKRSTEGFYLDGTVSFDSKHFVVKRATNGNHEIRESDLDFSNDEVFINPERNNERINSRRQKRQTTSNIVEMLLLFDDSVIESFEREYGENTNVDSELVTYAQVLLTGMNARYQTVTDFHADMVITVELTGLVFVPESYAQFKNDNREGSHIHASNALSDLVTWREKYGGNLPANDHMMWVTDELLGEGGSTGTIGIAYVDAMCSRYSVSITEDFEAGSTIQVAAHELGHSLSSLHDGEYSGCSNSQSYMMSAYVGYPEEENLRSNPFRFSPCSADAIYDFVTYSGYSDCLRTDDDNTNIELPDIKAGEEFSKDQQCRQALDDVNTRHCPWSTVSGDDFCLNLECENPYDSSQCISYILPYDHTECAPGKWCVEGRCVSNPNAGGGGGGGTEGDGTGGDGTGGDGSGGDGTEGDGTGGDGTGGDGSGGDGTGGDGTGGGGSCQTA